MQVVKILRVESSVHLWTILKNKEEIKPIFPIKETKWLKIDDIKLCPRFQVNQYVLLRSYSEWSSPKQLTNWSGVIIAV